MIRSRRMAVVLRLAQRAEETAVAALRKSREQLAQARQTLQQIESYQAEYLQQLNSKTAGLSARGMINDREFLQQVGRVLATQQQQIRQLQQDEVRHLSQWQACYQRRQGVERLIERLLADETAAADRLLQKEMDELARLVRRSGDS